MCFIIDFGIARCSDAMYYKNELMGSVSFGRYHLSRWINFGIGQTILFYHMNLINKIMILCTTS